MATQKTLNSELREYLKEIPRTLKRAKELEARAASIAMTLDIPIHTRREGRPFMDGLNVYPSDDKSSVGALLYEKKKVYGWRWSLKRSIGHRWSD